MAKKIDPQEYRAFLYKQVDGQTVSKIFTGQDAVDEALKEGWHTTFADFVDDLKGVTEDEKHAMKDVCSIAAGDANILANADDIDDLDKLKEAYERVNGKPVPKNYKSIDSVRKLIRTKLGTESKEG